MTYPQDGSMTMRLTADAPLTGAPGGGSIVRSGSRPPFQIVIPDAEGNVLVRFGERDGVLFCEGDETRWTEGARRFVRVLMEWSGQVGISWREAATQEH